jgi:foldase protein PrsA
MKKINKKETKREEVTCCCKNPANVRNIHIAILLLIVGVAIGFYYKYGNVATVNGKGISRIEYYKKLEKNDAKQLLGQMITEALIENEANKKGVKIEKNLIDDEIKKIDEQVVAQGQTLDALLEMQGMTRADLEGQIKMQKIVEKLAISDKEITQEEIDEFIKTNKDQLPEKATKIELNEIAKEELERQLNETVVGEWLEGLKNEAKIIYK